MLRYNFFLRIKLLVYVKIVFNMDLVKTAVEEKMRWKLITYKPWLVHKSFNFTLKYIKEYVSPCSVIFSQ